MSLFLSLALVLQNQKLDVPKKTKLFVDQAVRERESALLMHRVFQHDLYLLRLNTARAYVSSLITSANPVSSDEEEPIKMSAQVGVFGVAFLPHAVAPRKMCVKEWAVL